MGKALVFYFIIQIDPNHAAAPNSSKTALILIFVLIFKTFRVKIRCEVEHFLGV